ncbi:MAG: homoserine kinase, partial [Ilumatobacteraceae bacterium]
MTSAFSVSAPGSSANLGAGFDVLGLAVDLRAEVGLGDAPQGAQPIDKHHPAAIAYERVGGSQQLWSRSRLPMGRGLGYSGAARAAG